MKIQGIIKPIPWEKSIEAFISPLITFCWILNLYFSVSMSLNIYPILSGALVLRWETSLILSCLLNQVPKIRLILHSGYHELFLIFSFPYPLYWSRPLLLLLWLLQQPFNRSPYLYSCYSYSPLSTLRSDLYKMKIRYCHCSA